MIAHRADHTAAHENTLAAIESAIRVGVDYVELDVRRTRDGHHILLHDRSVDRTTDGHGSVTAMTLAEVRALRVVDRGRPALAPDRIPTFEEALATCRGRMNLYLDFKDGDRAEVVRMLRAAEMAKRTLVYCGAGEVPVWRAVAPELPLLVSPPEDVATNAVALVRWARELGVEALDGDWNGYSAESVHAAEAAGIRVWPDMQDPGEGPVYWERIVALGFSGLQSDHPGAFRAWCRARGKSSQP